jgi:hypothetical protein
MALVPDTEPWVPPDTAAVTVSTGATPVPTSVVVAAVDPLEFRPVTVTIEAVAAPAIVGEKV